MGLKTNKQLRNISIEFITTMLFFSLMLFFPINNVFYNNSPGYFNDMNYIAALFVIAKYYFLIKVIDPSIKKRLDYMDQPSHFKEIHKLCMEIAKDRNYYCSYNKYRIIISKIDIEMDSSTSFDRDILYLTIDIDPLFYRNYIELPHQEYWRREFAIQRIAAGTNLPSESECPNCVLGKKHIDVDGYQSSDEKLFIKKLKDTFLKDQIRNKQIENILLE
jgi:hypothetical protein